MVGLARFAYVAIVGMMLLASTFAKLQFGKSITSGLQSALISRVPTASFASSSQALLIRGGSKSTKKTETKKVEKSGMIQKVKDLLAPIKPISRAYLLLVVLCSVIHGIGLPAQGLFGLDAKRLYELWRPFTSVAYLGPPSMSMVNSAFFLVRFGQTLEVEHGSGPFAWFLLVQVALLSALGLLLGMPYQAQAMIAAIIHASSRINPLATIPFQFGLNVASWQLPFCMMAIDCLSQQSLSSAWPHIIGILSGHVYLFATDFWPSLGGIPRLMPPKWIVRWLGDKPSALEGLVFRKASVPNVKNNSKKQRR